MKVKDFFYLNMMGVLITGSAMGLFSCTDEDTGGRQGSCSKDWGIFYRSQKQSGFA